MSTVGIALVNYANRKLRKRKRLSRPRRSSSDYSGTKSRARARAGPNGNDNGRKIGGSTDGVRTSVSEKRDFVIISKNWAKVSLHQLWLRLHVLNLLPEKRAAAQKAEADFFALLKESGIAKPGAIWKDVCLCCYEGSNDL